ncbi:MAG: PAS domain-containing protein [Pseudomonadota bacterium]
MNNKLYWSPQVFRIHGLEIADDAPTLDDAISYYHLDDQDRVRDAVTAAIEDQIPFSFEARLNTVDGRIVPVQAAGQVVLDAEKKPVAMVGAIVDLSTILRDRMLVKQFEDVQALLDIGFYSFDVHNNRPYWSRSLYRMLGFDPDTHTPTVESAVEVFHPDDRERIAGYVSQAIAAGEGFHYEARLLRSDGEVLPCEGHGSTLPGPDGHTAFVYGFFRLINK